MKIFKEHFMSDLPPDIAKYIFKQSVETIEMAISSYCNRQCNYCQNHIVDRHSEKKFMSDGLFINIMTQLNSIDYSGSISIHRYNEPLENIDDVIKRVSSIRGFLKNAGINIFTNGDYLTEELLHLFANIGVNTVHATYHASDKNIPYSELVEKFKNRVAKFNNVPFAFQTGEGGTSYHAMCKIKDLAMHYQVKDFFGNGLMCASDRGGSIEKVSKYQRVEPCLFPFNQMQIEYDGTLLPCCNIHSDLDIHKSAILGKLDDNSDIFVEWTNSNYVKWRKSLIRFGIKESPCTNCADFITIKNTPESHAMCSGILEIIPEPKKTGMANWIEITTKVGCKNLCTYCPQVDFLNSYNNETKILTYDDFKRLLPNINKDIQIHFSGFSESMLNDDSIEMMIYAFNQGYDVVLYSTLVGFTLEKAQMLKESGIRFNHTIIHEFEGVGFNREEFDEQCKIFSEHVNTRHFQVTRVLDPVSRGGHLKPIERKIGKLRCIGNRIFNNVLLPNGDVFLCCSDWGLQHKIGNLFSHRYDSNEFQVERKKIIELQNQDDSEILCRTCEWFQ